MIVFNDVKGCYEPECISRTSAELYEIATHLDLESLALVWAIRNRQIYLNSIENQNGNKRVGPQPFGLPDPTRGATHFHRHNESPPWAATKEPIVLIGDYLFYDLRSIDIGRNPDQDL